MLLIADSGSTKTDWVLMDMVSGERQTFQTAGFNPMIQQESFISEQILAAEDLCRKAQAASEIRYFGAGCSSPERRAIVRNILCKIFPEAEVHVSHDTDAAIIATCGKNAGFACILGTGSNAILFDGQKIVSPRGYLGNGYILGDEGSGAYLGKMLMRDFLYRLLPDELEQHLITTFGLTRDLILNRVYQQPRANSFLAQFAKDLSLFRDTDYVQSLLADAFGAFFKYNIMAFDQYQDYPVHFVGSIAAHFPDELRAAAEKAGVLMGDIVPKPIDRMVDYFSSHA